MLATAQTSRTRCKGQTTIITGTPTSVPQISGLAAMQAWQLNNMIQQWALNGSNGWDPTFISTPRRSPVAGGGGTGAQQTKPRTKACLGAALKENGVALALDLGIALAPLPGGELAKAGVAMALDVASSINATSVHQDNIGAIQAGVIPLEPWVPALTSIEVGVKVLPWVGAFVNGASLVHDGYPHVPELPIMHGRKLTKAPGNGEASDVFTGKWLLVVLLSMLPVFLVFMAI